MKLEIMLISQDVFDFNELLQHAKHEHEITIHQFESLEKAESALFETSYSVIILDWSLEGATQFVTSLKNDELFRSVPILTIIPEENEYNIEQVFSSGADNYVSKACSQKSLAYFLLPLVFNSALKNELVQKISELQDKSIKDFILLDLIKKYIPKTIWDIANEYAEEQKINIPEKEMDLTICFADIKSFTKMSQYLTPLEVIDNLNSVFDIVTKHVYENNGDIDKFIGDAFFGVFTDSYQALTAMVRIQKDMEILNRQRKDKDLPPIEFRIGIHSGPVIRGNVGGNTRFDNTLIGDTVNMASRLENLSRAGDILISEETVNKMNLVLPKEYYSVVQLRGREGEDGVYQVFEYLKDRY